MAEAADDKAPAKKPAARKTTASKAAASKASATRKTATSGKTASKATATKKAPAKSASPKAAAKKPAVKKTAVRKTTGTGKKAAATETTAMDTNVAATSEADAEGLGNTSRDDQSTTEKGKQDGVDAHSSSIDTDKIIAELKDKDWGTIAIRGVLMLGFGVAAYFAVIATFIIALFQFVIMVGTGSPNDALTSVISRISKYIGQCLAFLSFKTEEKPFPLDLDLPDAD